MTPEDQPGPGPTSGGSFPDQRWPAGQQVVIGPIPGDVSKWQVREVLEKEMGPSQERARLIHLQVQYSENVSLRLGIDVTHLEYALQKNNYHYSTEWLEKVCAVRNEDDIL